MSDFSKETDARINIDILLCQAGWNPADKSQVMTEVSASMADGRRGKADYLLLDQRGRPLAVIEAKKRAIEPYVAKNQALPYAQQLQAPFIFLSNGELIYFWDYQNDDARIVNSFFSRRDLERLVEMRSTRQPLATIEIPEYYTRQGEIRLVRPYQRETMQAIDHAVELGKRRFLLELPTGTGKTDLICLQLKRLIQSGYAEKILFLVDREQLAKQALEAIQDVLNQYGSYWLKPSVIRQEQQITVCLLQTMISRYRELTSGYFDVVVADECHRSIFGRMCVARPQQSHSIISTNLIRLTLDKERIFPEYFTSLLSYFPASVNQLRTSGDDGAYSFMNTTILKSLKIPLPPFDLQNEYTLRMAEIRRLNAKQIESQAKLNNLFQCLLYRAFSGELTAKWREAHMKELLAEMKEQAKALNLKDNKDSQQLSLL